MQHKSTGLVAAVRARIVQGDGTNRVLDLALPAVGEQLLNMMVGMVDTFLVGHLGAAALAGVGLSNQIVMLAMTFFAALATGTTALVARHTGAREPALANRIMHQSYVLGAGFSLVISLLCYVFANQSMAILGAQDDVIALGGSYLRIVSLSMMASAFLFIGNSALRGAGDTRTPMKIMAVVNVVNIVVAYTLIYGAGPFPALGVPGSAIGAALGRTSGALAVLFILLRGKGGLRLTRPELRVDRLQLARVINVGLPAGMEMLSMRLGMTVFAAIVASLGTAAYAAHQVVMTSESLSFMPGFGFSVAAATLVGQGLGAGDARRAEQNALTALRLAIGFMSAMGVVFFAIPDLFMNFFTSDPAVISNGIMPLRIVALAQPFLATAMVVAGALRGAGDTRGPFVVTTLCIWLLRLPLGYVLVNFTPLGLAGAWITMCVDQGIRSFLFFRRLRAGKWKHTRV
jgi:putative MATE family efflux protein